MNQNDPKTPQWRDSAHSLIRRLAERNSIVVSDMVVSALEAEGLGLDNYSSLGGVFKRASKAGFIVKTTETQQSTRGRSNSAKTVWISLLHGQEKLSPSARALTHLLMNTLDYNAATVRYASLVFRSGGMERSDHHRSLREFKALQDDYTARMKAIIDDFEKAGGTTL